MGKRFSQKQEKEMVSLFKRGWSATRIGKKLKLHTSSITRVLKRNGCKIRNCVGKNHPNWRGGKVKKTGYWAVWNPKHPRANNVGYVKEHVLIIEEQIGRTPKLSEPIHHIDHDRLNNKLNNLHLCKNHKEHAQIAKSLHDCAVQLIRDGKIKFKDGEYYIDYVVCVQEPNFTLHPHKKQIMECKLKYEVVRMEDENED